MNLFDELRLVAITDEALTPEILLERWRALAFAAAPGRVAVDLRGARFRARELLELGRALGEVASESGQRLIVNERVDIALALEADALHLREDSIATGDARKLWGARPVMRAWHTPKDLTVAVDADALLLSPIFEVRKGNPPLGLAALAAAAKRAGRARVLALGGVSTANAPACIEAGASGVAAIGAVFGAESPTALLRALAISK